MKLNYFGLVLLLSLLIATHVACKKDPPGQMKDLQQSIQNNTPPQGPSIPQKATPDPVISDSPEKITEDEIQNLIKNKVDGFQVKGLSKMDLSPIIMATTEFIEINSINFFSNDTICEVGFAYYLIPEELKNQDSIESDGMIFNVSKQYQQGLGVLQYDTNGWKLITLVNEFRQIDFLVATERR
jgi:hypothetical protein